uniref:(northern house mosquito) hypothetical protein n=1 Tax=Culex pipiens TaxID=7175 RepID=A0A8D8CC63_CULPI
MDLFGEGQQRAHLSTHHRCRNCPFHYKSNIDFRLSRPLVGMIVCALTNVFFFLILYKLPTPVRSFESLTSAGYNGPVDKYLTIAVSHKQEYRIPGIPLKEKKKRDTSQISPTIVGFGISVSH